MKPKPLLIILAVACATTVCLPACAGWNPDPMYLAVPDARLIGMGYTFIAVPGQPNPLYSNPACFGLGDGGVSLNLGYGANELDGDSKFIAVTDKDRGAGPGGLGYAITRWTDNSAVCALHTLTYTVGKQMGSVGALGVGITYRQWTTDYEEDSDKWKSLTGDLGFVASGSIVSFGVLARNVPLYKSEDALDVPTKYSVGTSIRAGSKFIMAADMHGMAFGNPSFSFDEASCGAEIWTGPVALRGGLVFSGVLNFDNAAYTGGIGVRGKGYDLGCSMVFSGGSVSSYALSVKKSF